MESTASAVMNVGDEGAPNAPVVFVAVTLFIVASLIWKRTTQWLILLRKSNFFKSFMVNTLRDWVYYRPFGFDVTINLDGATQATMAKRKKGIPLLKEKLAQWADFHVSNPHLVDCRFKKVKVLFPLLKELEEKYPNRVDSSESATEVLLKNAKGDTKTQLYLSCDACRYFTTAWYDALQQEVMERYAKSAVRNCALTLTPEIEENMEHLVRLTGHEKFRYSLSGSEAVDACFKDVRLSTGKKYIVRFKSAYHGHTSGVDSFDSLGQNNCMIYLKEMSDKSLAFLEEFHHLIAGVIVNPMMHFTGINKLSPPGEKVTAGKRVRQTVSKEEYSKWLQKLGDKTKYITQFLSPVAFIVDDIYFAFRVPELFSKNYFGCDPDITILGKGVAGSACPLSIICGKERFMMKYDADFLLKLNKVVGTYSAYPLGVIASNVFLSKLSAPGGAASQAQIELQKTNVKFDAFCTSVNEEFVKQAVPLRLRNFANTFSFDFINDSLYNSVYVQYLIANGVFVTNQATGKFNLLADWVADGGNDKLQKLQAAFVDSAVQMRNAGLFERKVRVQYHLIVWEFFRNFLHIFHDQIMEDKRIDIEVSHNHPVNKFTHFWSSMGMIVFAYPAMFFYGRYAEAMLIFLITHVLRQAGHFFYEKQDTDWEKQKFGHKDKSKKKSALGVAISFWVMFNLQYCIGQANVFLGRSETFVYAYKKAYAMLILLGLCNDIELPACKTHEYQWLQMSQNQFIVTAALMTIVPHFVEIVHQWGWIRGIEWVVKILTDPFTDLIDFHTHWKVHPKEFLDVKDQFGKYKLDMKTKTISSAKKVD
jgi:glutamate-1-semialdehyde aminotransferase